MQWPDERIEYTRSFHLLDGDLDRLTDEVFKELASIGPGVKMAVINQPVPVEHCPCCGVGFSRTMKPAVVARLTDPAWATDSFCSIYINPTQPSLALVFFLGRKQVMKGALHLCQGNYLHYASEGIDDRVPVRPKPSIRAQATQIVNHVLSEWAPAKIVIGTGDPDKPQIIPDLDLPKVWEKKRLTRKMQPTGNRPIGLKGDGSLFTGRFPAADFYVRRRRAAMEALRVGRNERCPCGSGTKFKHCCLNRTVNGNGTASLLPFHLSRPQVSQTQVARPTAAPSRRGETIEATGNHPIWVESGEELDQRPVPECCPAEVPGAAIRGRWVAARDLRVGDILITRDGRRVPVTNLASRHVKMKVYNLHVAGLNNYAVGHSGILVHNKNAPASGEVPGMAKAPSYQLPTEVADRGCRLRHQVSGPAEPGDRQPHASSRRPG
jgi:hypothetical protein